MKGYPNVHILLSLFNGARYLPEQLASIEAQNHCNWTLLVSDDGSTDGSIEVVQDFARRHSMNQIRILSGPQHGMAANFLFLLQQVPLDCAVAFCDQDDVWMPEKISRALQYIEAADHDIVAYTCRAIETNAELCSPKLSPWPARGPSFGNALIQNILPGNALVFSPGAVALLRKALAGAIKADIPFHDWWAYQIIAGTGGKIILDETPGFYYRQHTENVLGASRGVIAKLRRAGKTLNGEYADWISRNIASLQAHEELLTASARTTLSAFAMARDASRGKLARCLEANNIQRQGEGGDRALSLLAWAGRL